MLALVHPPGKACDVELSPRDRALLDFERSWRWLPGPKAEAIRAHLRMSRARYYRLLGALIERPAALAYDPLTVRRLRRRREQWRRARFEGSRANGRSR